MMETMSKPNYKLLFKSENFTSNYHVEPHHYKIKFVPHIRENELTFDGEVSIDFKNLKTRSSFQLNAKNLATVENVILKKDNKIYESCDFTVTIDKTENILSINFDTVLDLGIYNLYIQYKGQVLDSTEVLKHVYYFDKFGKWQWILLSDFQTEGVEELFPSWNNDSRQTTFEFSVKHNKEYTVLFNAPLKEIITADDLNSVWSIFEKTRNLYPRNFAFIVGNLEYLTAYDDDLFKLWLPKNTIDCENNDIKIVRKLWKALEDVTGVTHNEHQYNKLDVVVLPEFIQIKKRNWGLCIVNDVSIGFKKNIDKTEKITTITEIAISLIDHWFGDLIESVSYDYGKSLTYGLRSYLAQLIVDKVDNTAHSIDRLINAHGQVGNWNYDHSNYISRTIENVLGKYNFQTAMRNYILNNESKDQIVSELSDEIIKASRDMKETMKKVLKNWFTVSLSPTITVTRNYEKNTMIVTQALSLSDLESDWRYWVPLNWTTNFDDPYFEDTSVTLWYDGYCMKIQISITVPDDRWIIINIQHFGTYHINYDEKNWKLIINYLKTDNYSKIHLFNRIQLINDAFTFASQGFLDYSIPFELAKYLTRETEFAPWAAFLHHIEQLYYESSIRHSKYFDNFKKYALKLTNKLKKRVLLVDEADDDFTTRLLRISLVNVCSILESSDWGNYALTKLKKWLDDPDKYPISADMKVAILNSGMRFADEDTWNKLWEKFKLNLENPKNEIFSYCQAREYGTFKDQEFLHALCCVQNIELLKKFIIMIWSNVIEDVTQTLFLENLYRLNGKAVDVVLDLDYNSTQADGSPVFSRKVTFDATQNFIKFIRTNDHLQKFNRMSQATQGECVGSSISRLCAAKSVSQSNEKLNKMKKFFDKKK
ncbi:aminopeptidase N-like [Microplitis mediator]|uniref:aminopeptidase N-like n=1 Tax=Microplitis mediator TaxID=375433 RepID=UPI002556FA9F|nr:aminopeptidase N-like [Microplitis mediator]